ncbi:MAG TPA: vWA domain-containing protein [Methylococcus sp.]|nr:vWA domain-containing protein [Methylococcus sp.]
MAGSLARRASAGVVAAAGMSLEFTAPWVWVFAAAVLLPWFRQGETLRYSSLAMIPEDGWSTALDLGLRGLASLAILALIAGLAGPFARERWEERVGTGAHVVLLLDRSSSMNENFAGRYLGGAAGESKNAVARRVLADFVERRREDLFAMVAFSAAPMYVLPLTQDREAVLAAIQAAGDRGHGVTNIASGLAMALEFFAGQPVTGSRIVLLVSDGATQIEEDLGDRIRQWFQEREARLYWIYLRSRTAPSLARAPDEGRSASPEYALHRYFQNLGVPYTAYEAENPEAVASALADVERLANQPLRYRVRVPRQDLSETFFVCALGLLLPVVLIQFFEVRSW